MVHRIRKLARGPVIAVAFRDTTRYLIASTGRAGSTMLCAAVTQAVIRSRYRGIQDTVVGRELERMCMGFVDRLSDLPKTPYVVYKTHDHCDPVPNTDFRCVFVYGDPLDSAQSVEQMVARSGMEWFRFHQYHLRAKGRYDDLYQEDVLNYEGQLTSWLTCTNSNIICIDYDDLWHSEGILSSFLGFAVRLPERRARSQKSVVPGANEYLFARLRSEKRRLKALYQARVS